MEQSCFFSSNGTFDSVKFIDPLYLERFSPRDILRCKLSKMCGFSLGYVQCCSFCVASSDVVSIPTTFIVAYVSGSRRVDLSSETCLQ